MNATIEIPSPDTIRDARAALRQLVPLASASSDVVTELLVRMGSADGDRTAAVPRQAFELFLELLGQLANGNAVTILPVHAELTTQQAADLLNVSRPFLVQLLEADRIPHRRVGTHRRILAADVLRYKREDQARRRQAMDELTANAQANDLGY